MRAQHRKPARNTAVVRAATAAGALAATATLTLATPNLANAATAPNHTQVIDDFSHALDNFLSGANSANQGGNGIWNPIASQSGGILPILSSSFRKDDLTDIKNVNALIGALRDIVDMDLPWGTTPGSLPNIVLPGGQTINVGAILPGQLPGVGVLDGVLDLLDGLLAIGVPGVPSLTLGSLIGNLPIPALGDLIKGLEISHSKYQSGYDWGILGAGKTDIQNNFIQTPGQLILDLTTIPLLDQPLTSTLLQSLGLPGLNIPLLGNLIPSVNDLLGTLPGVDPDNLNLSDLLGLDLPTATVWVPQGSGNYNLLGFSSGWWAAVPTAALAIPSILGVTEPFDLTISVPITSVGASLPFGLAEAGNTNMTVMLPLDNGMYSPVALNMTNVNTAFGFGVTNINVTSNNYIGTNGINVNNGQNVLLLQNPLLPIPIVYSLGGFNVGPDGFGIYMPSLFGISLLPNLQLGTAPSVSLGLPLGADQVLDALGIQSLIGRPLVPTSLLNVAGFIPGVTDAWVQGQNLLSPFYLNTIGALLNPLSAFAADQYGPFINGTGTTLLKLSEMYKDIAEKLGGAAANVQSPATTLASSPVPFTTNNSGSDQSTTGKHAAGTSDNEVSVADLADKLTPAAPEVPSAPTTPSESTVTEPAATTSDNQTPPAEPTASQPDSTPSNDSSTTNVTPPESAPSADTAPDLSAPVIEPAA